MQWIVRRSRYILTGFTLAAVAGAIAWPLAYRSTDLILYALVGFVGGGVMAALVLGVSLLFVPIAREIGTIVASTFFVVVGIFIALSFLAERPATLSEAEEIVVGFETAIGVSTVAFLFWRSMVLKRSIRRGAADVVVVQ